MNLTLEMTQLSACPVCKSANIQPAIETEWGTLTIHYYACTDCGQMFLNPRMSDKQTLEYYASGIYRDVTENGINDANLRTQSQRAEMQDKLVRQYLGDPHSHLEIGCSASKWLMMVSARTNVSQDESTGVEPDARYRDLELSRLFRVESDIAFVEYQPYDLISMSHVLEHFNHPLDYLRNLVEHYSGPHTRFMVEVPNIDFLWGMSLNHPMAFNAMTLTNLFARVDYKPVAILYHGLGLPYPYYLLTVYERK